MIKYNKTDLQRILMLSYSSSYILVYLPICVYILYLGFVRWRSHRNSISHSDFFTYNMVALELITVFTSTLSLITHTNYMNYVMSSFSYYGETIFPVYTSIEQYMAVVYPVTYLSLKQGKGLWIRYGSCLAVWLLALAKAIVMGHEAYSKVLFALDVGEIAILMFVMLFCTISVLVVLCQPKPGSNSKMDKSKQKPCYILLIILVVLVFRFCWNLYSSAFCAVGDIGSTLHCLALGEVVKWVNLVTTLLMPLLYLQRYGKLC